MISAESEVNATTLEALAGLTSGDLVCELLTAGGTGDCEGMAGVQETINVATIRIITQFFSDRINLHT